MQILLPTWLGSYPGSALDFDEYEYKTLIKIPMNSRVDEPECMRTRWFDYVRLHPLQATYWFAECYRRIYVEISLKEKGLTTRGGKDDFLQTREATSFWRLREFCDLNGFEYEWFLRQMMNYRTSTGEFKNYLPRPQHLLKPDPAEVQAIIDCWADRLSGNVLMTANDPWFLVSNWEAAPDQVRYEDCLIEQVKRKRIKHYSLSFLVYKKQMLRFERACKEFPDEISDVLRDAEQYCPVQNVC